MRIYGIDFTSSPRPRKPITCLECQLDGDLLTTGELHEWPSFDGFEEALRANSRGVEPEAMHALLEEIGPLR